MEKKNIIYVNFPISLLKDAFKNIKNMIDLIFDYAVYKHSQTLEYGDELEKMKDAAKFFEINFGNIKGAISMAKGLQTNNLYDLKAPNASINIAILWDYYNNKKTEFDIACFCAFCAIKSILGSKDYVKTNKGMILVRMFGESKVSNVSFPDEFNNLVDAAKYIYDKYKYSTNAGGLSVALKAGALKAEKRTNNKKVSYLIKRSDLDEWAKTVINKNNTSRDKNISLIEKYSKRYHIDAILTELQLSWNLKLYSDHSRGFYLSFTKSLEDLAVINELSKRSNKESELTKQKRLAKEAALRKLGH